VILLFSTLLGGIGLFLLGMILMSDGLKAAAGGALQRILERSTGTTFRAVASGAGLTALVQSSSATTLATIGFVSAGLLTFPSALGVIIGANVGTTSTGWIVALLGLKFNFGTIALPFIGVGALLRLLSSGARAHMGMALAGFGLIFVAIDLLQGGMGEVALRIDLGAFSAGTLGGRFLLVLIGIVMTVLLQSSSAAVALTLTAVHTGAIGLVEAAFLVIGQNLGTTVKAALAAIGASIPAKRTAAAHILFNALAAAIAFIAALPLLALSEGLADAFGAHEAAVVLTIFHTTFNVATAAVVIPFLKPFARSVSRIIPERAPGLTRHLDRTLLELPDIAVGAARRTMLDIAQITFVATKEILTGRQPTGMARARLEEAHGALHEVHRFLGSIRMGRDESHVYARRLALLHAGDHVGRLITHMLSPPLIDTGNAELMRASENVMRELERVSAWLSNPDEEEGLRAVGALENASSQLAGDRRRHREILLRRTAAAEVHPDKASEWLDAMRHIDRVLYHTWRVTHHLASPVSDGPFQPEEEEDPVY